MVGEGRALGLREWHVQGMPQDVREIKCHLLWPWREEQWGCGQGLECRVRVGDVLLGAGKHGRVYHLGGECTLLWLVNTGEVP